MGYDFHITRAKYRRENQGCEIGVDEWLRVVQEDPELSPYPELGEHSARWSGPSSHKDPWLNWWRGNINTKNPDDALIEKMVAIAEKLGAWVQGDDGEVYPGGGKEPYHPRASDFAKLTAARKK